MTATRRRFLAISAAALTGTSALGAPNVLHFRALGADCTLTLPGPSRDAAAALEAVRMTAAKAEAAFSLWLPDSEVSRLNRDGRLANPSRAFRQVAYFAGLLSEASGGAFDVTVQPVWAARARGNEPDPDLVDYRAFSVSRSEASFRRPGMAVTFNGMAQGMAADMAASVLDARGYADMLINLGEFRGAGRREDGGPWRLGVAHPRSGEIVAELQLIAPGEAVATSAPLGTMIGGHPHIVDPRGRDGARWASVTVRGDTAMAADAVSTAVAAATVPEAGQILGRSGAREAVLIPAIGDPLHWRRQG